MKKKNLTAVLLLVCVLTLSACSADPYPNMTDAEYDVVVRYAAGLITRYRKGTTDKLTYLDADYTPEYLMAEAYSSYESQDAPVNTEPDVPETPPVNEPDPAGTASSAPEQQEPQSQDENTPPGGAEPQDTNSPDMNSPDDEPDGTGAQTGTDEPVDTTEPAMPSTSYTLIEQSGLQTLAGNVRVEYTGYSVKSVYPDTQAQGAVQAAPGDKLLVVDFSVQNVTDGPVTFNTAAMNPQFKLNINSSVQGFTMVTMIPNDLSGMDRELAPGERTDAVLLMEVPESLAKSVDTLDLVIKIRGEEEQTVKLE